MRAAHVLGMMLMLNTNLSNPLSGAALEPAAREPNVKLASQWWTELSNVVTPVGWRDHLHRFNIVYDGTILARPPGKPGRFEGEADPIAEGVQLTFSPSADGAITPPPQEEYWLALPDGRHVGDQGWTDHAAPVLWTRWQPRDGPMAGLELRQFVFAHMATGGEAKSGIEPMFAWLRLQVTRRDGSANAEQCGFLIRLNKPHIDFSMDESDNCRVKPKDSIYPRGLRLEQIQSSDGRGGLVIEEDDRVRMAVIPGGSAGAATFTPRSADGRDSYLYIRCPRPRGRMSICWCP
jgi:hypothetical protein